MESTVLLCVKTDCSLVGPSCPHDKDLSLYSSHLLHTVGTVFSIYRRCALKISLISTAKPQNLWTKGKCSHVTLSDFPLYNSLKCALNRSCSLVKISLMSAVTP